MLEAVDAKIDRARSELRLLNADIAAVCDERARLIVREECDDEKERWVYRGDTPKAPIQWSIRAGEFAYNLRSALDHLVACIDSVEMVFSRLCKEFSCRRNVYLYGGVAWPDSLLPQQTAVLSVRIPQLWPPPALIDRKDPPGAARVMAFCPPQQTTVSSVCNPQVCRPPELMDWKEPSGGMDWPYSAEPQQITVASVLTPKV